MKRRARKKNIWYVALAVAIALCMVLLSSLSGRKTSLLERAVKGFYYPAESAAARVAVWIGDLRDYVNRIDTLKADNAKLKMEIARLNLELSQAGEAVRENEKLYNLLELTRTVTQYSYAAADVISGSSSNFSSDFTIDAGSNEGLEIGMCVVSQDGYVIGSITGLGAQWSKVTTILDPTAKISAAIEGSSDIGVASGDFSMINSGKLLLKYLPGDADFHIGDTVKTTGTGGVYPSGLTIGHIENLLEDVSGLSDSATIAPAADFDSLAQVFVIVSGTDNTLTGQNSPRTEKEP